MIEASDTVLLGILKDGRQLEMERNLKWHLKVVFLVYFFFLVLGRHIHMSICPFNQMHISSNIWV